MLTITEIDSLAAKALPPVGSAASAESQERKAVRLAARNALLEELKEARQRSHVIQYLGAVLMEISAA